MKFRVSVSRKLGQPNYGSEGAGCDIEFDLTEADLHSAENLQRKLATFYAIADRAVDEQLIRARRVEDVEPQPVHEERNGHTNGHSNGRDYAPRDNDREYDQRDRHYDDYRDERPRGRDRGRDDNGRLPKSGKQLFGWAKDRDILNWFSAYAKREGLPRQFNDWSEREASKAVDAYLRSRDDRN